MTPLLVIRHAATDWNEKKLIQGRTNRPLSDSGREQVRRWRLPSEWAGAECRASPLIRALDTARMLGLTPLAEPALIEMSWGKWDGCSLVELRSRVGDEMAANEARGLDFHPPGGESPRDVQQRLKPFLRSLSCPTIAVTHKGVLRALYSLASGWDMADEASDKLMPDCAHRFEIAADGTVSVGELNIPLAGGP